METSHKNNFDLTRLIAALVVVIAHTAAVSQYEFLLQLETIFNPRVAVDSFFIISGFLIFRSFDRSSSLSSYTKKRVRRIVPGYTAVIIISALALFFISSASVSEYFNFELIKYLVFNLLTLNFLQSTLPGVFIGHTPNTVNPSLWTIKIEVMFYMAVPIIAYIIGRTNKLLTIGTIYLISILYSAMVMQFVDRLNPELLMQLEQQLPGQLAFFMSGALLYYYYDKFQPNATLLLSLAVFILAIHNYAIEIYFLFPIALAIVVIYFCLEFRYLGNFRKFGDFSYGIYIWHFPLLQVFVHFQLFQYPILALPLVLLTIFLVAYLSWHMVEKPFLARRSTAAAAKVKI